MATARSPSSSGRYGARKPDSGSGGRPDEAALPASAGAFAGTEVMCSWSALVPSADRIALGASGTAGPVTFSAQVPSQEDQPGAVSRVQVRRRRLRHETEGAIERDRLELSPAGVEVHPPVA